MRPDYYVVPQVLSDEECDRILEWGKSNEQPAMVGSGRFAFMKRRSKIAWISFGSEFDPIMSRVMAELGRISEDLFDQPINYFEPVQYTSYGVGGFYGYHMDTGLNGDDRLISATIELTDPATYIGGGVKFAHHPAPVPKRERGSLIAFPSLLQHKARTVLWGKRQSLVFWGSRK